MGIISKWHIPPYIKEVIIYNTLNRSRETSKNEEKKQNYRKNVSDNDQILFLNFSRIFSQRILSAVPKGIRTYMIFL